ncbi:MAG TPA: urea carboxylase-associated family protein [Burkholderiaceae bacterium]|nr:urea carboxylase-associated family protein [Burkholderiaceae bacterium]
MTIIAPKSGESFTVKKGQHIRITDIEGYQVADFVCFKLDDFSEFISQADTRVNQTGRISVGDYIFSNFNNLMFEIVEDKVNGVHDLYYSPCNSYLYEHVFKVGPRNGCFENLGMALAKHGIKQAYVPDPLNVFMHTVIDENYKHSITRPVSKPGDYLEMRALMDCLVAVSACAEDITECNNYNCTPIKVEVFDAP